MLDIERDAAVIITWTTREISLWGHYITYIGQ